MNTTVMTGAIGTVVTIAALLIGARVFGKRAGKTDAGGQASTSPTT